MNIKLLLKSMLYHTLTEENINKIIERKEKELEDIVALEKIEIDKIKDEIYDDLNGYYTDEEIDAIIDEIIEKAK